MHNNDIKGLLATLLIRREPANGRPFIAAGEYKPHPDYFAVNHRKLMTDFRKISVEDEMFALIHPERVS